MNFNLVNNLQTGEKPYVCDSCGKAFRVAANFCAHRKTHRKAVEKISLDAAVAEIGQFIDEQPPPEEEREEIHTLQMAQPVDALSQAIQEHLTQSGLGAEFATSDGMDYASVQQSPGYLKQILMGQFEDKE